MKIFYYKKTRKNKIFNWKKCYTKQKIVFNDLKNKGFVMKNIIKHKITFEKKKIFENNLSEILWKNLTSHFLGISFDIFHIFLYFSY